MKRFILTIALLCLVFMPLWAQEDSFFSDESGFSEDSGSALAWGGELESSCTINATKDGFTDVFHKDDVADSLAESTILGLTGSFAGPKTDFQMDLDLSLDGVRVNEAYGKYYGDYTTITAGYNQMVWGKADEYHVVDVLNSLDLSAFLQTNYLSMVVPKPMLKVEVPLFAGLLLEAAWIPTFEGNIIPMDTKWSPVEMKTAYDTIKNAVIYQAVDTYSTTYTETYNDVLDKIYELTYAGAIAQGAPVAVAEGAAAAAKAEPANVAKADVTANAAASLAQTEWLSKNQNGESFYTPMNTLDNSQFGVRLSGSAGGFDYGIVYYFGYNKMPSLTTTVDPAFGITDACISYDRLQTFGLEGSGVLLGFNLKAEFAYNMTKDFDGDNPAVHNNNIKWVGGFDRDIPLSNLNINIQEAGSYIINADKITESTDVEITASETENILTVSLSDNYNHEKVAVRLTGMYHFEGKDWMLVPELSLMLDDNWETGLSGRFFGGAEASLFGQFDNNDEVKLSASYSF